MSIRSYSSKEQVIFVWFMIPYTLMINLLIFGRPVFNNAAAFFQSFFISLFYFAFIYILFGMVARIIQARYPEDALLFKRIAIMLPIFYILNLLMLQGLYRLYELVNVRHCIPRRFMEWWATGFACVISTVITLINEAAVGWDNWKNAVRETEQIKNAYHKTKLLGLKGQVNPHFLFNCFNSLSSLINEDAPKAEKFLDEMTKVHRYMLRDDEQLTSLQQEMAFTDSYLYLIKERFGEAITVSIKINSGQLQLLLPPLSMHIILENIIYNNTASKSAPLTIEIDSDDSALRIKHNLHVKKRGNTTMEEEEGLDNLIKKYELFNSEKMIIKEFEKNRWIILPLRSSKKEMVI